MQLTKEIRKRLVDELNYCAEKMNKERDVKRKAFFYCNAAVSVHTLLHLEYDPQLVLIGLVLEVSGDSISSRIETIFDEKDASVNLIEGLFDKLYICLNELAGSIKEGSDSYKALEEIAELAFVTTDRGYYLYTKGVMKA